LVAVLNALVTKIVKMVLIHIAKMELVYNAIMIINAIPNFLTDAIWCPTLVFVVRIKKIV